MLIAAAAAALHVLLIGDSVTAGSIAGEGLPYATLLEAALPEARVSNAACSGSTTWDWLRPPEEGAPCFFAGAFELMAEPELPVDIAVIYLGLNDAHGFFEDRYTDEMDYRENLERLIARLREAAERVILVVPQRVGEVTVDLRLWGYRRQILELCRDLEQVECGPDLFFAIQPGLHPDGVGHFLIARALEMAIRGQCTEPLPGPRGHRRGLALGLPR
jgi:hypothetical protein